MSANASSLDDGDAVDVVFSPLRLSASPAPLGASAPVAAAPSHLGNGTFPTIISPPPIRTPHVSSNSAFFSAAFSLANAAVSPSNCATRARVSRSNSLFRVLDAFDASRFAFNRVARRRDASSRDGSFVIDSTPSTASRASRRRLSRVVPRLGTHFIRGDANDAF